MKIILLPFLIFCLSCNTKPQENVVEKPDQYITVLGIAQDAGFPHINCEKECCDLFYNGSEEKKLVSCLGLVDLLDQKKWLFDATPDMPQQLENLKVNHLDNDKIVDGVFLTHAHIGHYTGLMYFGHEAMGANNIPGYAMPVMKQYLEENGPWSQLVSLLQLLGRTQIEIFPCLFVCGRL